MHRNMASLSPSLSESMKSCCLLNLDVHRLEYYQLIIRLGLLEVPGHEKTLESSSAQSNTGVPSNQHFTG